MHTASQMCCFGQISIKPAGVQNARCCGGQGYNPAHQVNMVKDIVYCISDHEDIDTSLKYSENIPVSTLSSPMRVERMTFQATGRDACYRDQSLQQVHVLVPSGAPTSCGKRVGLSTREVAGSSRGLRGMVWYCYT